MSLWFLDHNGHPYVEETRLFVPEIPFWISPECGIAVATVGVTLPHPKGPVSAIA